MPMLLCKGLGGALVLAAALLFSHARRAAEEARLGRLKAFIALLRILKSRIDCYAEPQDTVLARCEPALLRACGHAPACGAGCDLARFLAECAPPPEGEEGALLAALAGELGRGYRAEQVKVCAYYLERLEALRDALSAELPRRGRLRRTLSLSAALGVILIYL